MQYRSRRRGRIATAAIVVSVAAVALSACTSGGTSDTPASNAGATPSTSGSSAATSAAAAPAAVITASATKKISPADPVVVSIANGTLSAVKLVNPDGKAVDGAFSSDKKSWRTSQKLGYGKKYDLTAAGANTDGRAVTKKSTVETVEPDTFTMPQITDAYGNSIGKGNTYGVGMLVRVHFDEGVNKKRAEQSLSVSTTPKVAGGWYWRDNQNVWWRPQSYYPAGTKVSVKAGVYGKKLGDGLYGQDDKSASFTIGQKRVSIASGKKHHVQVKVYWDGKLKRTMPTSMGKGGYEPGNSSINYWTMKGTYTVINHENPAIMSSSSFGVAKGSANFYEDVKVPYSTKVSTDGIYLHEKNDTAWAQGDINVSHGCLNLVHKHAKWFFDHSRVGDIVQMVKTGGPTISFDQGGQWSVPWSKWAQGSALS